MKVSFYSLGQRIFPYVAIFFLIETILRLTLLGRALLDVEFDTSDIFWVMLRGVWFDTATAVFFLLPLVFYFLLLPSHFHGKRRDILSDKILRFAFSFVLLFDAVAEHLFWTEFSTRFNFIAIDYLVYTQEVIGNITESYPIPLFILSILLASAFITWFSLRFAPLGVSVVPRTRKRALATATTLALCGCIYAASSVEQAQFKNNAEASELAANGIYNLFSAFWHNEIDYSHFYTTESENAVAKYAHALLAEPEAEFLNQDGRDLTRIIRMPGKEEHKNVMLVVMESLSADYMGTFGNKESLTPNLDKLAQEGLLFSDTYATGTRTVRGLEAITLSIPPTPGQSIVRRPGNDNLFSLGFIFKDRGYDTRFIYGGYGYFDNMNTFFAGNGFDIIDRTSMDKSEIQFANVWGICDEDMFARAIREADASFKTKTPFMHLIMTTSNHRPFTFPAGRIEMKSHSGRNGGVKYADYSIGKFIEEAKKKPWFKDTLFVFISDHTAGAGGKAELDPRKYHIPMIFYAPGFIKPSRFDKIVSQIDMAPIMLGMLNFSYYTKFYGEDILHDDDEVPHAFISNYQKVALVKYGKMMVLAPKRKNEQYSWPDISSEAQEEAIRNDAIAYYQSASWWREQYRKLPTTVVK